MKLLEDLKSVISKDEEELNDFEIKKETYV